MIPPTRRSHCSIYIVIGRHLLSEGVANDEVGVRIPLELAELGVSGADEKVPPDGGPQVVRDVVLDLRVEEEITLVGAPEREETEPKRLMQKELGEPCREDVPD